MYVLHGSDRVLVAEIEELPMNHAYFSDGILFVGIGSDIGVVLFRLNCTPADVRWLESLKIEAP